LEIIEEHDVYTPNDKFKEFLENKAVGFGLSVSALQALNERQANPPEQVDSANAVNETVEVEGVKLEKQPEQTEQPDDDWTVYLLTLALLLLALAGYAFESRLHKNK